MNKRAAAVAALTAVALPLAGLSPAGAAVPKTKPTFTVPCGKKTAKWWNDPDPRAADAPVYIRHFAAMNPCKQWLSYSYYSESASSGGGNWTYYLRPGGQFNWWITPGGSSLLQAGVPRTVGGVDLLGLGPLPKCVVSSGNGAWGSGKNTGVRIVNNKTVSLRDC
ncbi:MAG: hypothetical protein ACYC6M_16565 [Terriglobales bacterium]